MSHKQLIVISYNKIEIKKNKKNKKKSHNEND